MADKRQRKPTEKAREFLSNVKRVIKRKASHEITSRQPGKRPMTMISSSSEDSESTPPSTPKVPLAPTTATGRRAVVRTEEEEEALHTDDDIVVISDNEDPDKNSEAELGELIHSRNSFYIVNIRE
jgi:hypothetical protein